MTIIKRITSRGFKSFAHSTEFIFGPKYNCIIGPNGSGKSNCADALCFVLGKSSAKGMRAEKTANLIYNGGKQGKPAREAEVTIEFDNSKSVFPIQADTIKITRIAKNTGNSVYKINNDIRTRQEVVDLLNAAKLDPDGHNIILQGDIVNFIELKPAEKRAIIEEIAGISSYEDKKQKCISELEKVDSKLNEAEIILAEREANLRELKKERDQAIKYKDIQQLIQENKATLVHLQIKEKEIQVATIENKFKDANEKIEKINEEITKIKQEISLWKEEIKAINIEITEKGEKEQLLLRKDIEDLRAEIVKAESRLETCQSEIQKINSRKQQLSHDLHETEDKVLELQKEKIRHETSLKDSEKIVRTLEKEILEFREKHGIDANSANELEQIEQQIENNLKEINAIQEQKQAILRERDLISFKTNSITDKLNAVSGKLNTPETIELKEKKSKFKEISAGLSKATAQDSIYASQLHKLRQDSQAKAEEFAKLQAKNAGIQERITNDHALKEILKLKSKMPGIHGTVSELGKVNQKYSLALEIAAGFRILSVVVDNDETAQRCIQYLRENKLGVATFMPLNKIKERPSDDAVKQLAKSKNNAIHGLAIELVDFKPEYKKVFSQIFGDTLIVDDIASARAIGIGKARMVSLQGDLFEPSGAMIGGFRNQRRAFGFKEKELDSNLELLEKEITKLQATINHIENKRTDNENVIAKSREERAALEGSIIRIESSLNIPEKEMNDYAKELEELSEKLSVHDNSLLEIEKTHSIIDKAIVSLKEKKLKIKEAMSNQNAMTALEQLEKDNLSLKEKIMNIKSDVKNSEMQLQNVYQPEKEKLQKILKEQEKDYGAFTKEISDLNEMLKQRTAALKEKEKDEEKFHSNIKDLALKRDKTTEKISGRENDIAREEERNKTNLLYANEVSIERAKTIAELEGLQKQFEPFRETKLKRGVSMEQLKEKIIKAEQDSQLLGSINMRAFEVYETIEKEHGILVEKANKLKLEKEDVFKMMAEIEHSKKEIFMRTYSAVSARFKSIFLSLSTKGEAQIILENPENPFEGGMDIEIKIIGSKYLDIKSLSGGEKTMAALAFIFAIQEYSPSPFYLLDEVDAALDRTNSALLAKLIKKYCDKAQYIVISHNDTIINDADLVYGVSMKEGISKVVGLKF